MNIEKKINILFVLPNFDTGGSEKLVVDLVKHLNPNLFNPIVCVFFNGVYAQKMQELKIPFYVVHGEGRNKNKIEIVRFLNTIVRKHKINVVNTHHPSTLLQGLLSFKLFNRTRLIHTEHSPLNYFPHITAQILMTQCIFMKFVDTAVGISQGVCDYMRDKLGVPEGKIVKILNGVDIEKFRFLENEKHITREEYRRKMSICSKEVVIGIFANLRKEKNHTVLIKAIKLLKDRGVDNIKLVLAGDGPEKIKIKDLIKDLKLESCILLLGVRHDIPELMNMIDIYCLPSFFEGLPFSLIEAMAAGLPCVATNVDGNREIIRNLQNGILVECDNPEALANAFQELSGNEVLCKTLGRQAFLDVKDLSFDNMIKKYEELFLKNENKS